MATKYRKDDRLNIKPVHNYNTENSTGKKSSTGPDFSKIDWQRSVDEAVDRVERANVITKEDIIKLDVAVQNKVKHLINKNSMLLESTTVDKLRTEYERLASKIYVDMSHPNEYRIRRLRYEKTLCTLHRPIMNTTKCMLRNEGHRILFDSLSDLSISELLYNFSIVITSFKRDTNTYILSHEYYDQPLSMFGLPVFNSNSSFILENTVALQVALIYHELFKNKLVLTSSLNDIRVRIHQKASTVLIIYGIEFELDTTIQLILAPTDNLTPITNEKAAVKLLYDTLHYCRLGSRIKGASPTFAEFIITNFTNLIKIDKFKSIRINKTNLYDRNIKYPPGSLVTYDSNIGMRVGLLLNNSGDVYKVASINPPNVNIEYVNPEMLSFFSSENVRSFSGKYSIILSN